MNYSLLKDVLKLVQDFENENLEADKYSKDIEGFKDWAVTNFKGTFTKREPDWEGKENGRSPESVISTSIVHLNRYAKRYSKSAIYNSDFSTQDDFIYLINLKTFGAMTKMELIKKNIHEKPGGMQIIRRLLKHDWVKQSASKADKRSKIIEITEKGMDALEQQMSKIRQATEIVTGNLTSPEKIELIRLLKKLDDFHQPIYEKNFDPAELLDEVINEQNLKQ